RAAGLRIIRDQAALKRKNSPAKIRIRQGQTAIGRVRCACKVQSAIGAGVRTGKGVPVKGDWEWERNSGGAIIAMVAYVGGTRNDAAGVSRRDIVFARSERCGRRWRRRGRGASRSIDEVKLQAVHQPARVALKLCRMRAGVALRAYGSTGAGVTI